MAERPDIDPDSLAGIAAANFAVTVDTTPPRTGLSVSLPELEGVSLATAGATNAVPNNVDQGRGIA